VLVDDRTDREADLGGAAQRRTVTGDRAWMRARSRSVVTSSSPRLRVRSAARSGLRQTTSRSPGNSGAVMLAMSR
jgi:hypothetical protein